MQEYSQPADNFKMNLNSPILARLTQWMAVFFCIIAFITPIRIWLFFGRCLGRLMYHILVRHRNIALVNLRFIYGDEKPEEELQQIIRDNFLQMGMIAFEAIRSPGYIFHGIEKAEKRITFEGLEHVETAKKGGKGILLLSAHFGMGEIANIFYTRKTGRKLNFILRKFDNPHLQKVMCAHNKKFGINLLYKQNGLRPAIKSILKGEDLVIFPDQRSNLKEGIVSSIFGKKSTTLSILPALSKKLGSPILPMFIVRQEDNISHKIIFFPPIIATEDDSIEEITQLQNDAIEKAVRMKPDHWLWMHRRWKEDFPEMYK